MPNPYYHTVKHRAWREIVLRKAKYKCEECARYGRSVAANVAHHMKPIETHPELRYAAENGRALCYGCHNKAHPERGRRPPTPQGG